MSTEIQPEQLEFVIGASSSQSKEVKLTGSQQQQASSENAESLGSESKSEKDPDLVVTPKPGKKKTKGSQKRPKGKGRAKTKTVENQQVHTASPTPTPESSSSDKETAFGVSGPDSLDANPAERIKSSTMSRKRKQVEFFMIEIPVVKRRPKKEKPPPEVVNGATVTGTGSGVSTELPAEKLPVIQDLKPGNESVTFSPESQCPKSNSMEVSIGKIINRMEGSSSNELSSQDEIEKSEVLNDVAIPMPPSTQEEEAIATTAKKRPKKRSENPSKKGKGASATAAKEEKVVKKVVKKASSFKPPVQVSQPSVADASAKLPPTEDTAVDDEPSSVN